MQITTDKRGISWLKIEGCKRVSVSIHKGPWIEGVDPETIKVYPRKGRMFPAEIRAALVIENDTDIMTDYFDDDKIRLLPGHPLHASAKAA